MKRIILIPHLEVHNANALSSPFTIGFPAMTAWLGAVHALQRKMNAGEMPDIKFHGVGVVSHHVDLQTYKGVNNHSIIGTGNPLKRNGRRPSIIEAARCHLKISLVIEFTNFTLETADDKAKLIKTLTHHLNSSMKIAGGDVLSFGTPIIKKVDDGDEKELKEFTRKLRPGYALIERRELMVEAMKEEDDALDALLKYVAMKHMCEQDDTGHVTWTSQRETAGWIVPIATGFHGISDLGQAENQRDPGMPHRFAESLVTLGEFRMIHHISSLDEILWHYSVDLENDLYLCKQNDKSVVGK